MVSTRKITGVYDSAYPGPDHPLRASVYGKEYELSPFCTEELAKIKPGAVVTLYLTADGVAAGAETGSSVPQYGILKTASAASVTIAVPGYGEQTFPTTGFYGKLTGKLVTFTSYSDGVGLGEVSYSSVSSSDIDFGNPAGSGLSPFATVYETNGSGVIGSVSRVTDMTGKVPAEKVLFAHKDGAGMIDILVLENYTFGGYLFGFLSRAEDYDTTVYTLSYGDKDGKADEYSFTLDAYVKTNYGYYVGIIPGASAPEMVSTCKVVGTATLADFTFDESVKVDGKIYPIADNYCVYSDVTKTFTTLEKAKTMYKNFKIYTLDNTAVIIIAS